MTDQPTGPVRAAGALLWRRHDQLEVAVVHRPKYADWSWPKGKLDPGESWAAACVREVREETGLAITIGRPLPDATYPVGTNGTSRPKVVRYWAAEALTQALTEGRPTDDEVDEVAWLGVDEAARRLDYQRDREQLSALAEADAAERLTTWPLAVVRHAKSVPRSRWKHADQRRPLDEAGATRATDLVPVLAAYGIRALVSSPSARCAATIEPYARATGVRLRLRDGLSEEGFTHDPASSVSALDALLRRGTAAAVCSHRPVLPALLGALAEHCFDDDVAQALRESGGAGLVKGEVLVAHVSGRGSTAVVVAVERHDMR